MNINSYYCHLHHDPGRHLMGYVTLLPCRGHESARTNVSILLCPQQSHSWLGGEEIRTVNLRFPTASGRLLQPTGGLGPPSFHQCSSGDYQHICWGFWGTLPGGQPGSCPVKAAAPLLQEPALPGALASPTHANRTQLRGLLRRPAALLLCP